MERSDLARMRMARQGIAARRFEDAEAVVRWLGAVQTQEYEVSRWSIGLRAPSEREASVEQALSDGRILRTHVLRPTWHFVLSDDIRWLVELTAPRIRQAMAYYDRQLGLDEATYARSDVLIVDAIAASGPLTRNEVGQMLSTSGLEAKGQRLSHLLFHAELGCLICSGPRRGKNHSYALLADRAPNAKSLSQEDALMELSRRFFFARGPATAKDFATWAQMTRTDARRGLDMLGAEVESAEVDGRRYWWLGDTPETDFDAPRAHLVPGYDEYFMGYFESKDVFGYGSLGSLPPGRTSMLHAVVVDGVVAGHWRRKLTPKELLIDLQFYRELPPDELAAVEAAVQRYGLFVGLPTAIGNVEWPRDS